MEGIFKWKYCSTLNPTALYLFFSFFPPCSSPLPEGNQLVSDLSFLYFFCKNEQISPSFLHEEQRTIHTLLYFAGFLKNFYFVYFISLFWLLLVLVVAGGFLSCSSQAPQLQLTSSLAAARMFLSCGTCATQLQLAGSLVAVRGLLSCGM